MAKYVRETKAGKAISAYVILNAKSVHVATVQAHFSDGGTCLVNVWAHGDAVTKKNAVAAGLAKDGEVSSEAHDAMYMQQGRAGGYGYDKFTAALSGLYIDGVRMSDHCGHNEQTEALAKRYARACIKHDIANASHEGYILFRDEWDARAKKIGARFANYDSNLRRYTSLFLESGLERLTSLGYRVINGI